MSAQTESKRLPSAKTLRYLIEAAAFFFALGFFRILGLDAASAVGGFLGRHVFRHMGVMNRARENVRAAYPDKTPEELEGIITGMCDNLGRTAAEYAHLDKLRIDGDNPRLTFSGTAFGDQAYARGKGVIFFSGHFANWEVMPFAAAQFGYKGGEVYRPVNNPYVDRWIVAQRKNNGTPNQIAKGPRGTRQIFTSLRRGEGVFLLADQKTNEGLPVSFFGRKAMTTLAPAMLALKCGAVLVPASNERIAGARFQIRLHEPIEFSPSGDDARDVYDLTVAITQRIEQIVRDRPSQWLWLHRRWPTSRKQDNLPGKRAVHTLDAVGVRVDREGSSLT